MRLTSVSPADLAKDDDFQKHYVPIQARIELMMLDWQRKQTVSATDIEEAGRRILIITELMTMMEAAGKPAADKIVPKPRQKRLHKQK